METFVEITRRDVRGCRCIGPRPRDELKSNVIADFLLLCVQCTLTVGHFDKDHVKSNLVDIVRHHMRTFQVISDHLIRRRLRHIVKLNPFIKYTLSF